MNDLEVQVRDSLRRHEADAPSFDPSDARRAARRTRRRQILNVAALGIGAALVIGLVAGLGGLQRADRGPTVGDQPPSVATPTPSDTGVVKGWPVTNRNPAGVYSWDGRRCGIADGSWIDSLRSSCTIGHMHNGVPPPELQSIDIYIDVAPEGAILGDGATEATVAGHDGIHRRIDARREEWIVDIEGTAVAIRLEAEPGASEADLAEAHAIIGSMRTEPPISWDNVLGFRLVFTLTTNDWTSG